MDIGLQGIIYLSVLNSYLFFIKQSAESFSIIGVH